jgi:hypothetical protein
MTRARCARHASTPGRPHDMAEADRRWDALVPELWAAGVNVLWDPTVAA